MSAPVRSHVCTSVRLGNGSAYRGLQRNKNGQARLQHASGTGYAARADAGCDGLVERELEMEERDLLAL